MANISFDLKNFSPNKMGIGRYSFQIVKHLIHNKIHKYFGISSPEINLNNLNLDPIKIEYFCSLKSTFLRSIIIPFVLDNKIDIHHSFENNIVLDLKRKLKKVSTIHDLIVFSNPEYFTKKHQFIIKSLTYTSIKYSDHIICPSQSTKNDILRIFNKVKSEKISVTPLASNLTVNNNISTLFYTKFPNIHKNYILSVGSFEPRKNLKRLISAFRNLKSTKKINDIDLVLVGGKGWLDSGIDKNEEDLRKEGIIVLGFVEDQWLPAIYTNAFAFIYPSLHEGFGLPPLEAMSCGAPVLMSKTSSLPEVGGDAALYFDPLSVEEIENAIEKIVFDVELRNSMTKKSMIQSQKFSWERTAELTEEVYAKVLEL